MPNIYLSPSTQEGNRYVIGGTEEDYMNRLADALVPYLTASGIRYTRNAREETAKEAIRDSNAGDYDLHLALHSNASPEGQEGTLQGPDVYFSPYNRSGEHAADIIANNLRSIYPHPQLVDTRVSNNLGEVLRVKAPAAFLELAYHDNPEDATWIADHIPEIARNLATSITTYFGLPLVEPQKPEMAMVNTQGGRLNLRARPSMTAAVKKSLSDGTMVTVLGLLPDWAVVEVGKEIGYVSRPYLRFLEE